MPEKKLLAFPLYPGLTPLDLVGPLTVLRNLAFGSPYRTVVVGERVEAIGTDTSMRIVPAATFADVPHPFAVVVPGGGAATLAATEDQALLGYVRSATQGAEIVGATGNGALVLAAAGLLEGRRAAAHWAYRDALQGMGATWAEEPWVIDGRFWTAGGGAAGIDLSLALLARLTSERSARLAQLFIEYDPEPPFGGLHRTMTDAGLAARLRSPSSVPEGR